ncbi:MAG: hypothetical protein ABIO86_21565 [Sphingomonas sp.]
MGDPRVYLRVKLGANGEMDVGPAISRIDIQDEDRGTDKATLVMDDHVGIATDVIQRNVPVTIEMGWETEHAVLFAGRVHNIGSYTRSGETGRLQFEVRDLSELLNVRPTIANRQHSGSLRVILTQLASEANLMIGAVAIDPMPSWPDSHARLLEQGDRTNWQLIQDVARDYGARAFVEVNVPPGAPTTTPPVSLLYFYSEDAMLAEQPLGKLTLCHGWGSLINFQIMRVGTGATPSSAADVIDPTTGEVSTETAPAPAAPPPAPAISGSALDQITAARGEGAARSAETGLEVTSAAVTPRADAAVPARVVGTPSDPDLARRRVRPDQTRALGLSARGLAMGTVFLRAKASVEIEGHSSEADGRWYLKRVNHIIEQSRAADAAATAQMTVKTYRTSFEATR